MYFPLANFLSRYGITALGTGVVGDGINALQPQNVGEAYQRVLFGPAAGIKTLIEKKDNENNIEETKENLPQPSPPEDKQPDIITELAVKKGIDEVQNQIKTWEVGDFKNIEEAKQVAKDNKITFEDLQRAGVRKQITFKKAEFIDGYDVYFDKKLIGQIENVTEELRDTNPQYLSGKTRAYNLSTIDDYGNVGSDPYDTVDGLQNAKDVIKGDIAKILVENSDKGRNLSKIFKEMKYDKKGLPIRED